MQLLQWPSKAVIFGPSPIDWCEENWTSGIVAENHNTVTNAAYVLAAAALLAKHKSPLSGYERSIFAFFCFSLLLTGLTSGLFHATLVWGAQKADETFENWTVLVLFHCTFASISSQAIFRRICIHSLLVTLGIFLIPTIFCEVHLIFISFATVYRFQLLELDANERSLLGKTALYAAAGFGAWLCDFFACNTFRNLYLHAYGWHILTAMALYSAGLLLHSRLTKRPSSVVQDKKII
jgi:hypothetical protein